MCAGKILGRGTEGSRTGLALCNFRTIDLCSNTSLDNYRHIRGRVVAKVGPIMTARGNDGDTDGTRTYEITPPLTRFVVDGIDVMTGTADAPVDWSAFTIPLDGYP